MPTIQFEPNLFTLAFALCVSLFVGRAFLRMLPPLSMPRMRLPHVRLGIALPNLEAFQRLRVEEDCDSPIQRNRTPAMRQHDADPKHEPALTPESLFEETMRSLDQAFSSFEEGRICADTYRSLLLAERRAVGRHRARLATSPDESSIGQVDGVNGDLSEANTAIEAVEWCLAWLDDFERSRNAV